MTLVMAHPRHDLQSMPEALGSQPARRGMILREHYELPNPVPATATHSQLGRPHQKCLSDLLDT